MSFVSFVKTVVEEWWNDPPKSSVVRGGVGIKVLMLCAGCYSLLIVLNRAILAIRRLLPAS